MKIKICGITNKKDALLAAELGADMIGFVFYKQSRRFVEPKTARDIADEMPPQVSKVGVFVDEDEEVVRDTAGYCNLEMVQFHGDEASDYCARFKGDLKVIKAFRVSGKKDLSGINDYDADFYLLDTYRKGKPGGTGEAFDWEVLCDFEFLRPVILSGGLKAGNVLKAIKKVSPYGVDVSSGVEARPGVKDAGLMREFIDNVRKAE